MRLSIKSMAATGAAVWGGAMLLTGVANLRAPRYGENFLRMMASLYPGYRARRRTSDVVVGALYGALDGAVFATLTGVVYNRFAPGGKK